MASLKFQILKRLDQLKRFGVKKKKEKEKYREVCKLTGEKVVPNKTIGIHSRKSCDNYKKWGLNFARWERQAHPEKEFKKLDNIPKEHVGEWLRISIDKGNSPYTTGLMAASMAKIMQCKTTSFGIKISKKGYKPKRTRGGKSKHFSEKNNWKIIKFNDGCGFRREELASVTPEQMKMKSDGSVYIDFVSKREWQEMCKNGKPRFVCVIEKLKHFVWECKLEALKKNAQTIWEEVPQAMQTHKYRRVYAQTRYKEAIEYLKSTGKKLKLDYICRDGSGRRYCKAALAIVDQSMGHNRLSVIVNSYFDVEEVEGFDEI